MFPCAIARLALASLLALAALPAPAQLFRAYLTLDGSDANPCTLVAPCRLLPAALTAVADGGEVWMLDSANYNTGPVNITKSVTILAVPGALGSVVGLGGNAINIATAGVKVKLRNLVILPFPGNSMHGGVHMSAGDRLVIEGCRVTGFNTNNAIGLRVEAEARVVVEDSVFSENTAGAAFLGGAGNGTTAHVSGSHFDNNSNIGLYATSAVGTTRVAVIRSTASGNGNEGFLAASFVSGTVVELSIMGSQAANNVTGVRAQGSSAGTLAVATVAGSQIFGNGPGLHAEGTGGRLVAQGNLVTRNAWGLRNDGGLLESASDNAVRANTADTSGTITAFSGT